MRLYISGPMTGYADYNFPAFNRAAAELRAAGYDVENPADGGAEDGKPWTEYLREDLRLLLDCEGVALLPGWSASRGAKLEIYVAEALNMPVASSLAWFNERANVAAFVAELTA